MPVAKPQRAAPLNAPLPEAAPLAAPRSNGVVAPMADDAIEWAASPARLLHDRLVATFAPPAPLAPAADGLSPRAKLAIIMGSCALLWLGIGGVVAAAIL